MELPNYYQRTLVAYQTFINHTGDNDHKKFLEDITVGMKQEKSVSTKDTLDSILIMGIPLRADF